MLPWIEKYRPNHLNDIILDEETKSLFMNMIDDKYFPQILFYGPPGTGKTTTIICLLKIYQAKYNCSHNVIHLNASDERGIETIRTQIHSFIYTQGMFHNDLKFLPRNNKMIRTLAAIARRTRRNFRRKCGINFDSQRLPSRFRMSLRHLLE